MKKRLTFDQKKCAAMTNLYRNPGRYPMTAYAIGKAIGYSNGQALKGVLEALLIEGRVMVYEAPINTGNVGRYYYLSELGVNEARAYLAEERPVGD